MTNATLVAAILELWHISRIALAGGDKVPSRHERMIYVKTELHRSYPALVKGMTPKKVWLTIEDALN